MADRLLKLAELADELGVPEATLRFWRHQGRGPRGFKVGRRVVFRASEVARWLDEQAAADPRTPAA